MKEQSKDIYLPIKIAFFIFGLILIILTFLERLGIRLPSFNISKKKIAYYYKVNKRTLTNWFNCFLDEDLRCKVHNQRKLPLDIVFGIYNQLGNPDEFPVLSRKVIIELGEGTYNQLVITINRVAKDNNLPMEKLAKMRTFPPVYGKMIAENFGLHPKEIKDHFGIQK